MLTSLLIRSRRETLVTPTWIMLRFPSWKVVEAEGCGGGDGFGGVRGPAGGEWGSTFGVRRYVGLG